MAEMFQEVKEANQMIRYRNPDCSRYAVCLDRAARKNRQFTCQGCQYQNDRSGAYLTFENPDAYRDYVGSLRLLAEMVKQEKRPPYPVRKLGKVIW